MATKSVNMACVTVGFQHFLMPADKAMKVVELMQTAFECEQGYQRSPTYTVGEQPRIELCLVRPDQIRRPSRNGEEPRLLTK